MLLSLFDSNIVLPTIVSIFITLFGLSTGFILLKLQSNLGIIQWLKKLFDRKKPKKDSAKSLQEANPGNRSDPDKDKSKENTN